MINRTEYLDKLISKKHNGLIKIITGVRRCGKSYLLFKLFKNHLLSEQVEADHMIEIAFDDRRNKKLRDPDACLAYVTSKVNEPDGKMYYILLDEVQFMSEFEDVLNSFLHMEHVDVYVTGSNSKFLSSDIITEFRGRGDEVRVYPLSFSEFYSAKEYASWEDAWNQYYTYGGLPYITHLEKEEEKIEYLTRLFKETYLKDIIERNKVQYDIQLEELVSIVASSTGSLTNPNKLANTFRSTENADLTAPTIKQYLAYLEDAFLIEKAVRYDIKGKKYMNTPYKYYFVDVGLRNARLNFRQQEETHIMENIIYNELKIRGYAVDIGIVDIYEKKENGTYAKKQVEVDFIVNKGSRRYYVQSAFRLSADGKRQQEERPLVSIHDSFKKIIIVKDNIMLKRDENGIITMGLKEFLLNRDSLDLC